MPPAAAPFRMHRPRPSRAAIVEARASRRRRHLLFGLSLLCGAAAGAVLGALEPRVWSGAFALLVLTLPLPGIALGVLAGPRIWPANVLVVIVAITTVSALVPWIGLGITGTSLIVLVVGYAGRGLWSLVVHGRLWVPLGPEGDVPRGGGGVRGDGHAHLRLQTPTVTASTPPEKAFRTRWWW